MKLTKALIATAALSAVSVPAFAQAVLSNTTDIDTIVSVTGNVSVGGAIGVGAEASAVTSNAQASVENLVITAGGANASSLTGSANSATGNVGINLAAGTSNAQSNDAAIAALGDATDVFANAQSFSTQISAVNANIALLTNNSATLDNSVNGATGNIGVNNAAGSGNMQSNQLAVASQTSAAGNGTLATASGENSQLVTATLNGNLDFDVTNAAVVTSSLLAASGNVAANVTAGYGNLQNNSLSIASAQ